MDVGIETVDRIHAVMQIDEEWTERRACGFTWWAHRLAQHIDVGPPVEDSGIVLYPVTSRVPVIRVFRKRHSTVEQVLGQVNACATGSSYVYDAAQGEITAVQRGLVHEQTLDWRPNLLAAQFMLQLCDAETRAEWLTRTVGGEVAVSRHPERSERGEPDDMLNVISACYEPDGREPSRFLGAFEFETICELAQRINAFSAGASAEGVAIEVPFGTDTALIQLAADETHPILGSGLMVFAMLPALASLPGSAHLANWLNLRDTRGGVLDHHLGSWCVRRMHGALTGTGWAVAHAQYIPSALYRPGLAMDAAVAIILKLGRVNRLFHPEIEPRDVLAIVTDRLRRATGEAGRET